MVWIGPVVAMATFIKKLFAWLNDKKGLYLIICFCYCCSFAAVCYIYSYEKDAIIKSEKSEFKIVALSSYDLDGALALGESVINSAENGYFILSVGDERIAYNNKIPYLEGKGFSQNPEDEIVIPNSLSRNNRIGDDILYKDKHYKIVGYANTFYLPQNTVVSNNIYNMWYMKGEIMPEKDISAVSSVLDNEGGKISYVRPPKVNIMKKIVKEPFFIFICVIIGLAIITTFVMSVYLISLRQKMLNVLLFLGLDKYKLYFYLVVEQIISFTPCVIIGIGIYFIFFAIFKNILTIINVAEILFFALIFLLIIITSVTFTYFKFLKRRYV